MNKYLLLIILIISNTGVYSQNLHWAKSMGGGSPADGWSIAADPLGNVYTTGRFVGNIDADPGDGIFNLVSSGYYDIFISKLDAAGNFVWAKSIGGPGHDFGFSIALDASGNVYVTGDFAFTVDFDPGAETYNLTSPTFLSFFILKLDPSGNFAWAKSIMATSSDYLYSEGLHIAVDGPGNVYTVGVFSGSGDFDPGAGDFILTSAGSNDIFISKLDTSGNFVWAKAMGGTSNDQGLGMCVDVFGNVYTTGFFTGSADFDPGPETFDLTTFEGGDVFISKLDASGDFVWAKSMQGTQLTETGFSIAVDDMGNVYTTGSFGANDDFDPGAGIHNLSSVGNNDIFISKLNASGNFVWAKSIGGASPDLGDEGRSIALDAEGNVYTTGYFFGTADFDPGTGIFNLTSAGGVDDPDIFISKLDASGNFVSAIRAGGISFDNAYSLAVDGIGNVYACGYYGGTADFDPGPGLYNLTSLGVYDIFVLKLGALPLPLTFLEFNGQLLNGNGLLNWKTDNERNVAYFEIERSIDGHNYRNIGKVSSANNSGIHHYSFMDPGINSLNTAVIYYRLKQKDIDGRVTISRIIALSIDNSNIILFYPNPVKDMANLTITINKPEQVVARVIDITGRIVHRQEWKLMAGSTSLSLDLKGLTNGMYNLELNGTTIHEHKQFTKQ